MMAAAMALGLDAAFAAGARQVRVQSDCLVGLKLVNTPVAPTQYEVKFGHRLKAGQRILAVKAGSDKGQPFRCLMSSLRSGLARFVQASFFHVPSHGKHCVVSPGNILVDRAAKLAANTPDLAAVVDRSAIDYH